MDPWISCPDSFNFCWSVIGQHFHVQLIFFIPAKVWKSAAVHVCWTLTKYASHLSCTQQKQSVPLQWTGSPRWPHDANMTLKHRMGKVQNYFITQSEIKGQMQISNLTLTACFTHKCFPLLSFPLEQRQMFNSSALTILFQILSGSQQGDLVSYSYITKGPWWIKANRHHVKHKGTSLCR